MLQSLWLWRPWLPLNNVSKFGVGRSGTEGTASLQSGISEPITSFFQPTSNLLIWYVDTSIVKAEIDSSRCSPISLCFRRNRTVADRHSRQSLKSVSIYAWCLIGRKINADF